MNAPTEIARNVSASTQLTFSIKLYELHGKCHAAYNSNMGVEPDWTRYRLYEDSFPANPDDRVVGEINPNSEEGQGTLGKTFGAGYCLAQKARGFKDTGFAETYLVKTPVTQNMIDPVEADVSFDLQVELVRVDIGGVPRPCIKWNQGELPCRLRWSRAHLYLDGFPAEPGDGDRSVDVETNTGEFIIMDMRWGPGLSAALVAEDYSGKRQFVVKTPITTC